ncbi:MAG: hypothetical protein UW62_C0013G0012 [Candidatus Collierbacteria bacterium GW2011_GWB1_44_35]|uniref:HPr kinase n=3 Tax=Candidatus Collieribacteriota TaxID=1752725 RepID=A0A0G1LGM2_9BACT|nr:MAG: hypothetical protein UW26_C0005G0015 [Candidatus Collierbacteria bacterium GW2011_GWF1_44_12]KKT67877.1 MAG: hypothetical protein UW62_C0013G0012 [Candidatus Collierbacteria bacterium GW2011_GWB1_44_35]KKT99453.1 MAG: hypothetical protein UW99_C0006G0026 [Candidatus Collierbacteria bacterium GW2011_GWC2_45_15]
MEQEYLIGRISEAAEHAPSEIAFSFTNLDLVLHTQDIHTAEFCQDYFESYTETVSGSGNQAEVWHIFEVLGNEEGWVVDKESRTVHVFLEQPDKRKVMRIIRSLVMLKDLESGMTMFKGAAIENQNHHGIVLIGEKRAGKTSLALSFMLEKKPENMFITNSQVTIGFKEGKLIANGYPMSMGIRLNVLESMKKRGNHNVVEIIEAIKSTLQPGDENRYYLEPKTLKALFDERVKNHTELKAIVMLKSTSGEKGMSFGQLEPNALLDYLKDYHRRFYNHDSSGWYKLFDIDVEREISNIEAIIRTCPVYELTYSLDHHQEAIELINSL